ncbi:MAG: transketolase [Candidatus Gastranaerophilaceae bacterium]
MLEQKEIENLQEMCKQTRRNIIKMANNAKSGHIGGAFSAVEILTTLYQKVMNVYPELDKAADYAKRDRFVLSKGHASAVYYSVLAQRGFFPIDELMTFRLFGSRLQGHPNTHIPGVEVATGSLGQGLSMAVGMALGLKLDKNPAHVFCYLGDGELQEGSCWEAFMHAPHKKLNNITAIIDRNMLQIDGDVEKVKSLEPLADKLKAFNWNVVEIDGHNLNEVYDALMNAKNNTSDRPTAIIAHTTKGKGVSFMENQAGWHGKAPNDEEMEKALAELA